MNRIVHIGSTLLAALTSNAVTGQHQLNPEALISIHTHSREGKPTNFDFVASSLGLRELAESLITIANTLDCSVLPLIGTARLNHQDEIEPLLSEIRDILEKMDVTDKGEDLDRLQVKLETIEAELGASGWNWREFIPYNEEGDEYPREINDEIKPGIIESIAHEALGASDGLIGLSAPDRAAALQRVTMKLAELSRKGFNCRDGVMKRVRELQAEQFNRTKESGISIEDFIAQSEKGVQFRGGDPALVQASRAKFEAAHSAGMTVMAAVAAFVTDPEWNPCGGGGCCGAGGGPTAPPVEQEQRAPEQQEGGESDEYEWITATRDAEGNLSWNYRVVGAERDGSDAHDEDVSEWSDEDIIDLTVRMLSVPEHQRDLIKIELE